MIIIYFVSVLAEKYTPSPALNSVSVPFFLDPNTSVCPEIGLWYCLAWLDR